MDVRTFTALGTASDVTFAVALDDMTDGTSHQITGIFTAHDEFESHWVASLPLAHDAGTDSWTGVVAWAPHEAPHVLSLSALQFHPEYDEARPDSPPAEPRTFEVQDGQVLSKPDGDGTGEWRDGSGDLEQLLARRESYFDIELEVSGATPSDSLWSVVVLAEHALLTNPTRVPGVQILPLERSSNGARLGATADLLTALAAEVGMTVDGAISFSVNDRPLALVVIPRLRASGGPPAMQEAAHIARRLLDIVCLNRGDSPTVLAAAVGRHQPNGTVVLEGATTLDRRYSGNLIGGLISGESVSGLNRQWAQAQSDARIFLWLRLFNEAIADARWDYRVFRCFNLLEGIAKEVLPKNQPVLDTDGSPRMQGDGKTTYTSKQARGAVYLLLRKAGHLLPSVGQPDGSTTQADLWDETEVWVAIRNEVAHTGSWEKPAGKAPSASWTKHNSRLSTATHKWDLVHALQSAAESVMHAAFAAKI